MKLSSLSLGRFALQGAIFGLSASIMIVIVSIVYAAASWGALPTVSSGSGLTATSWNDLVAHVNQSVKQSSSVITVSGSNVGIGTVNPNYKLEINGVLSSGKVQIIDVVTENTACSGTGLIAQDGNGIILSCQSGNWKLSKKPYQIRIVTGVSGVGWVSVNCNSDEVATSGYCLPPANNMAAVGVTYFQSIGTTSMSCNAVNSSGNGINSIPVVSCLK